MNKQIIFYKKDIDYCTLKQEIMDQFKKITVFLFYILRNSPHRKYIF